MGEEFEFARFASSPEGKARQRAAYRVDFYAGILVTMLGVMLTLEPGGWLVFGIGLAAVFAAFLIWSRRYPWRSIQEEAVLASTQVSFSRGKDCQQSTVRSLQKIELQRAANGNFELVTFRDRLEDEYTLWQPENSEALEQWIAEVAAPAGVPVVERNRPIGLWHPRYLFLESCLIGVGLMVLWDFLRDHI